MNSTLALVMIGVSAVIGAFSAFVVSYMKEKGKNLATKEDVQEVVKQVSAVTEATKKIEAEISDKVWDRQKQWEMKREIVFETSKAIMKMNNQLFELSVVQTSLKKPLDNEGATVLAERIKEFLGVLTEFDGLGLLIAVVCDRETVLTSQAFADLARELAQRVGSGDVLAFQNSRENLALRVNQVQHAFRKELGVTA